MLSYYGPQSWSEQVVFLNKRLKNKRFIVSSTKLNRFTQGRDSGEMLIEIRTIRLNVNNKKREISHLDKIKNNKERVNIFMYNLCSIFQ